MKALKNGYTLSELIVTLGIVGIIAALTIPGIINSKKNTYGITLARAAELTEAGLCRIISEAQKNASLSTGMPETLDVIRLQDVGLGASDYVTDDSYLFSKTAAFFDSKEVANYTKPNCISEDPYFFKFKKINAVLGYVPNGETDPSTADAIISKLYVDVNGAAAPNQAGRDIFLFGVANNGHLIPAGTQAYQDFDSSMPTKDACDAGNLGYACTARVAGNRWKIDY